jgi:outer membrane protein TolC
VSILAPFAVAFFAATAAAQSVTLADAVRAALRSDNDALLTQDEKVRIAGDREQEAGGQFDWGAHVEGGWQTLYVPKVANGVVPGKGVLTNTTQILGGIYYSASVGREFRNGISVAPGVTAYPSTGGASTAQTLGLTELRPSLGLRIPLLQGLGEEAADSAELSARATLAGTRFDRDFAAAHTVHDTVLTYWRCVATEGLAKISSQSLQDGKHYEESLRKMADRGLLEPMIVQRSAGANVSREIALRQAEDAFHSCQRDLAVAMTGAAADRAFEPGEDLPNVTGQSGLVGQLQEQAMDDIALNNRSDLKAARQYIAAALATRRGVEDSTSPILNLQIDPTRAIVSYTQSLENNTAEGKAAEALSDQRQAQIALHQLETQVQIDIGDAIRNLQSALSEWNAASGAERQMENVVSDAKKRAAFGITPGTAGNTMTIDRSDVLTSEDQLAQIRNQMINAKLLFASSVADLRLVSGTVHPEQETAASVADKFSTLTVK